MPAVTDHLRAVDWDSLEGPYGSASDVPRLLRMLRSEEPAARAEAEEEIEFFTLVEGAA